MQYMDFPPILHNSTPPVTVSWSIRFSDRWKYRSCPRYCLSNRIMQSTE